MNCQCLDDWNRLEYTTWFHFVVPFTGRFLFHLVSMGKCHQQTSSSAPVPTWSLSLRWDLDGLPLQEAYNQIQRFWMKLVKYSSINCVLWFMFRMICAWQRTEEHRSGWNLYIYFRVDVPHSCSFLLFTCLLQPGRQNFPRQKRTSKAKILRKSKVATLGCRSIRHQCPTFQNLARSAFGDWHVVRKKAFLGGSCDIHFQPQQRWWWGNLHTSQVQTGLVLLDVA